jgi:hypothetical protein
VALRGRPWPNQTALTSSRIGQSLPRNTVGANIITSAEASTGKAAYSIPTIRQKGERVCRAGVVHSDSSPKIGSLPAVSQLGEMYWSRDSTSVGAGLNMSST